MAIININYIADVQLTITLASLVTSATLVAGQESDLVDNTSNKYDDYLLSGKITTGTNPTADKAIEIWVIAPINDTPTWPDVVDGVNSAETFTNLQIKNSCGRLAHTISNTSVSDITYPFGQLSIAELFGGRCPAKFVVFVTHNTGVNLNATAGNHEISVQGITYTVT